MFFAFVAMSLAQAGDVDSYLGEIEAKYKDVKALQVNFTQLELPPVFALKKNPEYPIKIILIQCI